MIPKMIFFTKGVGTHKDKLASFEQALRMGGIEKYNLVSVSSILPPGCKIVPKQEGLKHLSPGQITYVVLAKESTNEANRLVSAAVGLAQPANKEGYGYLSEHHTFGETAKITGEYAEDLAATMLATTLGIELDPETDWDERKDLYYSSGKIIKTRATSQSAEVKKGGLYTTVIAAAVFLL